MADAVHAIPTEGQKAPAFAMASSEGGTVKSSSLKGTPYVLYFYPKDQTTGCTTEAQGFRDVMPKFDALGVKVFGVSPDDVPSHCKFVEKQRLNFALLEDKDHAVAEKYGLWVEKNMYGRKYWGVQRATFLIGADGKVLKTWPKVSPKGHAAEVLKTAQELLG